MNNIIQYNWSTTNQGNIQCYKGNHHIHIYFPNKEYPFYDVTIDSVKGVWYRKSFRNLGAAIITSQQEVNNL